MTSSFHSSAVTLLFVPRLVTGPRLTTVFPLAVDSRMMGYSVSLLMVELSPADHDWPKIRIQRALGPVKDDGVIVS